MMTWIAAAFVCVGCAGHQHGSPGGLRARGEEGLGGAGRGGREATLAQFFISPSGKPFRGRPGEPYPVAAWFAEADKDGDGRLTRAEFRADADAFFPVVDTDGDGVITMVEVSIYERDVAPEISRLSGLADGAERARGGSPGGGGRGGGGHGGGHGGGGRGHGGGDESEATSIPRASGHKASADERQGAAMFSLINEAHPIRGADADFSMTVTRAEWRAAADRRFARLDRDGDGIVAFGDLPQTPVQATGGRPAHRP